LEKISITDKINIMVTGEIVTKLEFIKCPITPDALPKITLNLPYLKTLSFKHCDFSNSKQRRCHFYRINLASSELESVSWKSHQGRDCKWYISVKDDTDKDFFIISSLNDKLNRISSKLCYQQEARKYVYAMNLYICCKSIILFAENYSVSVEYNFPLSSFLYLSSSHAVAYEADREST
jgi:hypothetical protein